MTTRVEEAVLIVEYGRPFAALAVIAAGLVYDDDSGEGRVGTTALAAADLIISAMPGATSGRSWL